MLIIYKYAATPATRRIRAEGPFTAARACKAFPKSLFPLRYRFLLEAPKDQTSRIGSGLTQAGDQISRGTFGNEGRGSLPSETRPGSISRARMV